MGKGGYGSRMSTNRGGVILNISSVQGLMAWPAMPTYSAAKAGMIRPIPVVEFQVLFYQNKLIANHDGVILNISIVQRFMAWSAMPTYSAAKAEFQDFSLSK